MLKQHVLNKSLYLLLLIISTLTSIDAFAAGKRHVVENNSIKMVIIPRTPQQMAAFYEGREFPAKAIEETRSACFFTVGIHNKSNNVISHDTKQWQLYSQSAPLSFLTKAEWKLRWNTINLPQRFQSTFRWTLLPKQLDFHPDEHEGGNITIPKQDKPFTLIANFISAGKSFSLKFTDLYCAKDKPS